MTPTKPVIANATWDGRKLVMADVDAYRLGLKRLELGAGEQVTIRVERPEDARKYHQLKFLWGHVYKPVAEYPNCGHTALELHGHAKAMFLPEGKLSTLDLSYEEMDVFMRTTEQWLRESIPDAFEAYDAERLAS